MDNTKIVIFSFLLIATSAFADITTPNNVPLLIQNNPQQPSNKSTSQTETVQNPNLPDNSSNSSSMSPANVASQPTMSSGQVASFETITNLAHSGQSVKAKQLALARLKEFPNDWDTRVILGYIYLWGKNYNLSKQQFELVLNNKPLYSDARQGLITAEIRTKNYQKALQVVDEGLKLEPNNNKYLYKKASIYIELKEYPKALNIINPLLTSNPNDQEAQDLLKQTKPKQAPKQIQKAKSKKKISNLPIPTSNEITYKTISNLVKSGQRKQAKQLAIARLKSDPSDVDTKVTLGYLYLWDEEYDNARKQFIEVLNHSPKYTDARKGLITVETRSKNYQEAFRLIEEGTKLQPENEKDFFYQKARIYMAMGEYYKAKAIAKSLLKSDPTNKEAKDLLSEMQDVAPDVAWNNQIFAGHETRDVSDQDQLWLFDTFGYSRNSSYGSIYAMVNYADRFGKSSFQYETDAYPNIPGGYAYLSYAYSSQPLFPHNRYAIEPFFNLPHGWEISGGGRYLEFDKITRIYTGSLGKYVGDYWISFRPYVTPSETGTGKSYYLTVRRFFDNAYDYISITGGGGSSPDSSIFNPTDINALRRTVIYLNGSFPVTKRIYLTWLTGYESEVYPNNRIRKSIYGIGGFKYYF